MIEFYAFLSSIVFLVTLSFFFILLVHFLYIRKISPGDVADAVQIPKLLCTLSLSLGLVLMLSALWDSLHLFNGSPMAPFLSDLIWQFGFVGVTSQLFFFLPFSFFLFESVGISPDRLKYLGCRSARTASLLEALITSLLVAVALFGSLLVLSLILHPPPSHPICPIDPALVPALPSALFQSPLAPDPPAAPHLAAALVKPLARALATLKRIPSFLAYVYSFLVHYSALIFALLSPAGLHRLSTFLRNTLPPTLHIVCSLVLYAAMTYTCVCVLFQLVSWKSVGPLDAPPESSWIWKALIVVVRLLDTLALAVYWLSAVFAIFQLSWLNSLDETSPIPSLILKTGALILISSSLPSARSTIGLFSKPFHDFKMRFSFQHHFLVEMITGVGYLLIFSYHMTINEM